MFEDYTTHQLVELSSLCAHTVEQCESLEERANLLLILEYIEEELTLREQRKRA
jgi:hypothetical protein